MKNGVYDLKDLEEETSRPSQWGNVGPRMYKAFPRTHESLPAGAYRVVLDRNDERIVYLRQSIETDNILSFKESISADLFDEMKRFWGNGDKFKKLGFLHRRGYLLYGPQGTGKSSIIHQIIASVIKEDGVVFICDNPKFFNMALSVFRQAEPDRAIVCVFEDIDAIIKEYGEDLILGLLDGTNMINKVLNIATTNYPEILDKRIISRPRRFDRIIKIAAPTLAMRTEYLQSKLPKKSDLPKWLRMTEGLSFASLSEAIISVYCLGNKFEETILILKDIENGHPSSGDFGTMKMGFEKEDSDDIDCDL